MVTGYGRGASGIGEVGRTYLDKAIADNNALLEEKQAQLQKLKSRLVQWQNEQYSYEFLTSQPDMAVTKLPDMNDILDNIGEVDRRLVEYEGLVNAEQEGFIRRGSLYVINDYTDGELRIDKDTTTHSVDGDWRRIKTNGRLGAVAGALSKHAIPINGLLNENSQAQGTYAMAAYATDEKGRDYIAIITVEQLTDKVSDIGFIDAVHAISGRIKRGNPRLAQGHAVTAEADPGASEISTISIADFLDIVNQTHQGILSRDVLEHFKAERDKNSYWGSRALYSMKDREDKFALKLPGEQETAAVHPEDTGGVSSVKSEQIEPAAFALQERNKGSAAPLTGSKIKLSELLDIVKDAYPDTLSQDVLNHFGIRRPNTELGGYARYSLKDKGDDDYAPVFNSRMERAVEDYKGSKIAASGLEQFLKSRRVKNDEIRWSGILAFSEGRKSVSKDELLDFIRANGLKIREITKEDRLYYSNERLEKRRDIKALHNDNLDMAARLWPNIFGREMPETILSNGHAASAIAREMNLLLLEYGSDREWFNASVDSENWDLKSSR